MTRTWALVLAVALVAASCGGNNDDPLAPIAGPDADETTTTTAAPTTTASTDAVDDTTEDTPDVEPADAEAAALQTWVDVMNAAATGLPDEAQLATIADLSSDNTTTQLQDFFPEDPERELNPHPKLTAQDDGSYAIDDCIIMNKPFSTDFSTWFIGQADPNPDSPTGYEITNVQLINLDPCVPSSIAEAAIEGYEAHQDARVAFFDPPNPDAPEIEATMTGEYLDFTIGLIDQLERDGQRLAGRAETTPRFWQLDSPTELIITDCQVADPELGVYDIDSGERTDLIPAIEPGQIDLIESTMILVDGVWKVSNVQGNRNTPDCETMPFNEAILQITGG